MRLDLLLLVLLRLLRSLLLSGRLVLRRLGHAGVVILLDLLAHSLLAHGLLAHRLLEVGHGLVRVRLHLP